jgi:16S rRNA processing protein RimM
VFFAQTAFAGTRGNPKKLSSESVARGKPLRKALFIPAGTPREAVVPEAPGPNPRDAEKAMVGRIVRPYGLTGALVVQLFTENPLRYQPGAEMLLDIPGQAEQTITIREVAERATLDSLHVTFEGIDSRETAVGLSGGILSILKTERADPDRGCYYPDEVVGMRVLDVDGTPRGEVLYLDTDSVTPYIQIKTQEQGELAIPFLKIFITSVQRVKREIRLREPMAIHIPVE